MTKLNPSRRSFLAAAGGAAGLRAQARRRPNLLFVIGDDHAGYVLGAAGNRLAQTPNLDRLAADGTRFAHHYCNSPVCTPSRQSFLTGQLPHSAGVTRLPTRLPEDKPTLARQLRQAGYFTGAVGKMHFNQPPAPGLHGFDTPMADQAVAKAWNEQVKPRPVPSEIRTKPVWRPFKDHARIWLNSDKLPVGRYYEDMRGTFIARQATRFLEENKDRGFALWVSFQEPHSPFDFPVEDRDRFDPARFDVPRVGAEDAWQVPLIFRDLTREEKQGIIAAYYTSVAFLDRNVGVVLDKLKALGLDENTLVVYMGDNGYSLGQHGRFEKHCSYEPAVHIPLLMRLPGRVRRGVVNDLTEAVDVPFTILDLLGAETLPVAHGQSLRPYVEGRRPSRPRDHIFSEYLENEEACVRTARWKFVYSTGKRARGDGYATDNPTPGRWMRLFDLRTDPGEFTDVAGKHPDVVKQLRALMLQRFRDTHPEAAREPERLSGEEALDFYLRPRDV
ncbi:MAG: sulfatase [Acidobacteria bacterium]|nr:sulfatase [Acidobacteriota bacterium]